MHDRLDRLYSNDSSHEYVETTTNDKTLIKPLANNYSNNRYKRSFYE